MKKLILIAILLLASNSWAEEKNKFTLESEPPVNCLKDFKEEGVPYSYEDYCIYQAKVGNITTIDIKVKAEGNELIYDIPYANLRYAGAIVQIYYTVGVYGKSQWFLFPDSKGIVVMLNSILLPIDEWVEDGFPADSYVRVVILTSE